ncbi:GNAT family N-acetyltransferase [Reinekea marinisedimentorum]|uniref:Ribosomal protein S18 acetylase RimI-like enzyme n=1 Tax=Reinekea marinisedimentorum TaxID=230495 RepID=A0A4R3I483_9GAMM|nr:GNAT family N-acetyltransferase [Reinekea marinisedimentorum]TCS38759.1 ribosomal protein S18 acetylase RimI-like enzyme [Reinekea marinisedimentorum]
MDGKPSMKIRAANTADLNQLVALNREVHDVHVEIEPSLFCSASEEVFKSFWFSKLKDNDSVVLVAQWRGTVVGYLLLRKRFRQKNDLMQERKCAFIEQVCVLENHRGQGVFQQLLVRAKELAVQSGFSRLELDVWSNNSDAKNAFLKSGFMTYNEKMKVDF